MKVLIVYSHATNNNSGFGNVDADTDCYPLTIEMIRISEKNISEKFDLKNVVIINTILLNNTGRKQNEH
jgi:hypothetical protein